MVSLVRIERMSRREVVDGDADIGTFRQVIVHQGINAGDQKTVTRFLGGQPNTHPFHYVSPRLPTHFLKYLAHRGMREDHACPLPGCQSEADSHACLDDDF